MEGWKKLLLAAAGAAGASCVLYYLLREEADKQVADADGEEKEKKEKKLTPEGELAQVQQILSEIVSSQEQMLGHMKNLTRELMTEKLSFDQTYKRLKQVQPDDPLERYGLTFQQFDALLGKHQNDPKAACPVGARLR
ncbi:SGR1 [Symbiodinium sp. CCMP2592]|nr:SGR1 [Symbiodinium sp. CCMP2592]